MKTYVCSMLYKSLNKSTNLTRLSLANDSTALVKKIARYLQIVISLLQDTANGAKIFKVRRKEKKKKYF